jgi:GNAT superfamily N-acetyltransferase
MEKITIRNAELNDLSKLTDLCTELGYPSNDDQINQRLQKLLKSTSDVVYVAVKKTEVIGWIHVFTSLRLESDPFAEIGGLVVSSEHRNKGIGRMLVNAADKWAIEKGFSKIRVRSRIERTDARRFYEKEGYVVKKSQNVFEKELD